MDQEHKMTDQFQRTPSGYGGHESFVMSCRIVIRNLAVQFPDFAMLAKIALVIPVTSVQNVIKTDSQNRLGEDRVSRLIMLNIHGKSVTDFDMGAASDRFFAMKTRRK